MPETSTAAPPADSMVITSKLPAEQRPALEQLLFFNANQHRVRLGIEQSIAIYGVPEIHCEDDVLRIRVGNMAGVQNLFAVSAAGRLLGVAVFARLARERFVVLHLGVDSSATPASVSGMPVLFRLMHEIRRTARRTRGVDRIELVYKDCHTMRLQG